MYAIRSYYGPIQGSAADLIKVAMINVHKRLHEGLPHTKMILQVHDELIFEVPDRELEEAKKLVKQEMEGVGKQLGLSVPVITSYSIHYTKLYEASLC